MVVVEVAGALLEPQGWEIPGCRSTELSGWKQFCPLPQATWSREHFPDALLARGPTASALGIFIPRLTASPC